MARPFKEGIDYFSHDTDTDNDMKIKLLISKYGLLGYGLYMKLIEIGYRENGYFCEINEDKMTVFASETKIEIELLYELIEFMCYKNLFNADIYSQHKILTSRRMQKNYLNGTERRAKVSFVREYLLIDIEKEKGQKHKAEITILSLCNTETGFLYYNNPVNEGINSQSKSKSKKRGEEIESKNRTETPMPNVDNSVNNHLPTNEPPLLFNNHSSFTFYEDCLPFDFQDTDSVRNSITKLIAKFCNGTTPTKSEITRIFNIVTGTRGARRDTCFKITAQTLSEFSSLSPEKKNFAYLSQRIEGKISDALVKAKENAAAKLKEDERTEIENMSGKINEVDLNVIADKFTFK